MKTLIAVMANHANCAAAANQAQTWAKNSPIDVRFAFGIGMHQKRPGEVFLPVPDDYRNLALKVQAAFRWARENGYTNVFKCDDDLYLRPERLLASGILSREYSGNVHQHPTYGPFAHGGAGYVVGNRALNILCDAPVDLNRWQSSEDAWVSGTLHDAGIHCIDDKRLQYERRIYKDPMPALPAFDNDLVSGGECHGTEMLSVHGAFERAGQPDIESMTSEQFLVYMRQQGQPVARI